MRSLSLKLGLIFLLLNLILCSDQSKKSKRTLAEEDSIKIRVCKKADTDYTMNNTFTTLTDFVDSISKAEPNPFLKGLISGGGENITTGLVDFLLSMLAYVIMIAFGLISLIVWPILWCLCCCKCCCFNKKKKTGLAAYIHYGVSIGLFTGILICSIIGLSNSTKFVQYFNGSSCYLLTFFDHIIAGDEKELLPRWAGINEIDQTLTNTDDSIQSVKSTSDSIFPSTYQNDLDTKKNAYSTKLGVVLQASSLSQPAAPDGATTSPSLPYQQLLPNNDIDSLVNRMKIEEQTTVTAAITALTNIKDSSQRMDPTAFGSTIGTVKDSLQSFGSMASDLSSSIGTSFVELQDKYTEYIVLGFQILFGLLIGISSLVIISLSIYVWLKIYWLKIVVHVLWNFTMLLTILSFLIGGVLGLLGHIGKEVVPVVGYLFSEGVNSLPGGQATDLISTCLNGDGDLSKPLKITGNNDPTKIVEGLYNSSIAIQSVKEQLDPITTTNSKCNDAKNQLSNWKADLTTVYKPDLFTPELNKATQKCGKPVVFLNKCPNPTVNSCYVIDQTSSTQPTNPSVPDPDCHPLMITIHKSANDNYKILNEKDLPISDTKSKFDDLMTFIKDKVDKSFVMTSDLIAALNPVIGTNNSFYSMLNCGFIKDDIIIFLDQFGNVFANSSQAIGITLIASSFFGFVGVFFFIASMNYFTSDARGDNKKDKKDDSISKKDKKEHERDSSRNFNENQEVDNNPNKQLEPSLVKYSKVDVKEDI